MLGEEQVCSFNRNTMWVMHHAAGWYMDVNKSEVRLPKCTKRMVEIALTIDLGFGVEEIVTLAVFLLKTHLTLCIAVMRLV